MAVGADFECINIETAKYNREQQRRADEARLEKARREAAYYRKEIARLRAEAGMGPAPRKRPHTTANVPVRVRRAVPVTAASGSVGVRTAYRPTKSIGEILGDAAKDVWLNLGRWIKARDEAKAKEPAVVVKKDGVARPFPVAFVGTLIVAAVSAAMLLAGNASLSEKKAYADSLRRGIETQTEQARLLDEQLKVGIDAMYVEDYAVNTLGMVKKSEVSRKYISLVGEDKIESKVG